MNRMTTIVSVAIIAAALGAAGGYRFAQWHANDLMTALRALDLNNRLQMLRLLRERKTGDETVQSIEISAISLLSTIHLEEVTDTSQSYFVLQNASKTLAQYTHDFPRSEFSDSRHREVAQLLSMRSRQ